MIAFDSNPAISYSNVTTVNDLTRVTGTATYNGTSAGDSFELLDGPVVDGVHTTQLSSDYSEFATVNFGNKTNVIVQDSGADTFTLDTTQLNLAAGLTTLKLDGTGSAGDTFSILSTGTTTNIVGSGNTAINVGDSGSVKGILGTLNLSNPSGLNTVVVDDSADPTAQTVTLADEVGQPGSGTIGDGSPYAINYVYGDTASLTLRGGSDATGTGDTFNVQATGRTTNIIGGAGNDTINVTNGGLTSSIVAGLNITDQGGAANRLIVNNSRGATAQTVTVTANSITGATPAAINYASSGQFTHPGFNDGILIEGPNGAGVLGSTFNVQGTSPGSTTQIDGGDGGDTFNASIAASGTLTLNGGNPTVPPGDTLNLTVKGTVNPHASFTGLGSGTATATGSGTTNWSGIETFPLPAGLGGDYDYQPLLASPLQPQTVPVTPGAGKELSLATLYTAAQGYGWTTTQTIHVPGKSYDDGLSPLLVGNPMAPQLQDGVIGGTGAGHAAIFRLDLLSDQPVQVVALLGEVAARSGFKGLQIAYSTDGITFTSITPTGGLSGLAHTIASVSSATLHPAGITPVLTGGVYPIWVRFQAVGAGATAWAAAGLSVRPVGLVAAPVVTTPGGSLVSDTMTVDTFSVSGASPGAVLTISASLGTVVTDARPELSGNQVIADASGMAMFQIRRPYRDGTSTVTVTDFTGAAVGIGFQNYELPDVRKFDMTAAAPTLPSLPDPTWLRVTGTGLYSAPTGYGWTKAARQTDMPTSYPAGSTPAEQALYRDFNYGGGTGSFQVYIGAYQTANVKVYSYPATPYSLGMTVSATNGSTATLGASPYVTVEGTAGADGILSVTLKGGVFGLWLVNGMEITRTGTN